jgi:hypothetical protein
VVSEQIPLLEVDPAAPREHELFGAMLKAGDYPILRWRDALAALPQAHRKAHSSHVIKAGSCVRCGVAEREIAALVRCL